MLLRPYQQRAVADLFRWWTTNHGAADIPLLVLPTAAGKSVICAEIVRSMFEQWPTHHPRTVVLVPSKELAEQNADKLVRLLPAHIRVGFVSASLGKKQFDADVIVATIGSIARSAHLLGNIKAVIVDECHLISNKGAEVGMYRKFLASLGKLCHFRTVGMTATPFRGNQVWLTDGDDPLFTGVASNVTMREMLDCGFIAPLVPPSEALTTRIDAGSVGIANGDYKVGELSDVVDQYLEDVAKESARIARDRSKWIAFTPSVANAITLANYLHENGIESAVVCGETPKQDRERLIAQFRAGELHCLVTVLALSVGFDVPDVDCIIWCRPTKSPVLYVQGMGRGVRIHPGKADCLVLDFTDTVERMGPVDTIKGKAMTGGGGDAPYCICPHCGERNHAAALDCVHCGGHIKDPKPPELDATASRAALLASQKAPPPVIWHDVHRIDYAVHKKEGKPDSLRVTYSGELTSIASEWVCFEHGGYARARAEAWWNRRSNTIGIPDFSSEALAVISSTLPIEGIDEYPELQLPRRMQFKSPSRIATRKNNGFIEIVDYDFSTQKAEA